MMEGQATQAVAPPSNPGVPMEHRAGEAVTRHREVDRVAKLRLGAPSKSEMGVVSRVGSG